MMHQRWRFLGFGRSDRIHNLSGSSWMGRCKKERMDGCKKNLCSMTRMESYCTTGQGDHSESTG